MFGYIRPLQGELKVRELERFKACYCGLCHALGKNYGLASRFILNYELVFLSMLLWDEDDAIKIKHGRCIASPCKKKKYCAGNAALDQCAGYSVILTWLKLKDSIADETFFRSVPYRIGALILRKAYKKAALNQPEFDRQAGNALSDMAAHESQKTPSLDEIADKFASILKAIADHDIPEKMRRPMGELLYHTGRWIYIMDACDDYKKDIKSGNYNPVALLYQPDSCSKLPQEAVLRLNVTLTHSNNLLSSAFELLPHNPWSQIVENIIYLGMPDACTRVFNGKWPPKKGNHNI
ncbi:MAG: DUF5685 family protein [Oscillospiraceae bacterium]|nr:DUF5685 family protein [Oscillospiraceae bacterium]